MNIYQKVVLSTVSFLPTIISAQGLQGGPRSDKTFSSIVYGAESFFVSLVGIIIALSFLAFLWGLAIRLIKIGNSEKQKEAKIIMVWGIIGLVVSLSFMGILKIGLLTAVNISG